MSSTSRTGSRTGYKTSHGTGRRTGCRTGFSRESVYPQPTTHPAFAPYRSLLAELPQGRFPTPSELTRLLPPGTTSAEGAPISFVSADSLPGADYERRICETGQVSTREGNWHDLFNALVWCRLPRLKAALNAMHYRHLDEAHNGRRGAVRDALTLLDESGALVVGADRALLDALARHDWMAAFQGQGAAWETKVRVVICGHALLEKLLRPYKAVTAHVLLLHTAGGFGRFSGTDCLARVDGAVAGALLDGRLLSSTSSLSPLPLAGIPGWWTSGPQDLTFYSDPAVFRALRHTVSTTTRHPVELANLEESP